MMEHFCGPMLLEPEFARTMIGTLKSGDAQAIKGFVRGPRTLQISGETIQLNNGSHQGQRLRTGGGYSIVQNMAIVPIFGPMFKGYGYLGFADQTEIRNSIRQATLDRTVSGIMLLIDSPGGSVAGTSDLADEVRAADAIKPVVAYVEDMAASAAYWTAASARAIYSNGGMVGSIGCVTALVDSSKFFESSGVRVIPIVTGNMKAVGMDGVPVTSEQVDYVQSMIDTIYTGFVDAVSKGRGISESAIRAMQARVYVGPDSKRNGLVNGITTFEMAWDLLRRASDKNYRSSVQSNATYINRLMREEINDW